MRDTYSERSRAATSAIEHGWDVYGDDDEHLGTVEGLGENYLLIQKGLIFTKDIYVPFSAVTDASDGVVRVNVGKGELESMGWEAPPSSTEGFEDTSAGATDSSATGYDTSGYGETQRERMALHEEEVEVEKVARQDTEQVADTVRREELDVSGTGTVGSSRTTYGASDGVTDDSDDFGDRNRA